MTILVYLLSLLFIVGGLGSCMAAKGAVHEIAGLVALLIGFMLFGVGLVCARLKEIEFAINSVRVMLQLPPKA